MERRFIPTTGIEIRARAEDGTPTRIVGYGAVYFRDGDPGTEFELWPDGPIERIMPGTFDRAVREDDVRGMYNHRHVIGRTLSRTMRLSVDNKGLRYDIDVPETQTGRDVLELIDRGDITGSSFGFEITDEEWRKVDGRTIREISGVRLFDTGPVDFPAYEGTTTGIRAIGSVDEAKAAFEAEMDRERARIQAQRDRVMTRGRVVELGI